MTTRNFQLGDILTVTTDVLLSPRGIAGVYDILKFMTGDDVFTHQIPRVMGECRPYLLKQHPQLAEVTAGKMSPEQVASWLAKQVALYGDELSVEPLPPHAHEFIDPVSELAEKMHLDRIALVVDKRPKV